MNVIIADDSAVVRTLVKKIITPIGYHPIHAVHGGEVIDILEERGADIDLILLDWNMPTMDGFQALEKIKKNPKFASIPVIMLTSESDEKKINLAYRAGVDGYIEKPFSPKELLECIDKVTKKSS